MTACRASRPWSGTLASSANVWANETSPASATSLPNHVGAPGTSRWIPNSTDLAYPSSSPRSSFNQIARYRTATQTAQIVTDEDGDKTDVWGRPVGLLQLPDGSLLLTDDVGNKIWHVTYKS